jgi:hypothetical protein
MDAFDDGASLRCIVSHPDCQHCYFPHAYTPEEEAAIWSRPTPKTHWEGTKYYATLFGYARTPHDHCPHIPALLDTCCSQSPAAHHMFLFNSMETLMGTVGHIAGMTSGPTPSRP